MKTLLLLLNLLLIFPHAFSAQTECEPGYVFDTARNFCVISSGSIEANTKAKECEGLSGQAYQDCFDKNVKDSLEANNINGDVSDPKQNGLHMAASIVTTSFGVYALVRGKELKACGKTSVYMIAAGGVTALLGEALAKRGYKKTLDNDSDKEDKKGLKQKYIASLEASDSNTEEGVDNLSQNQILAFDFQRDQELAKEKAHTSRKKVNEWAGGIYAAAGAVAIYEAIANGWALSATGDCKPTFKKKTTYMSPVHSNLNNSSALVAAAPKIFGDYFYIDDFSAEEILEISLRKVSDIFFPSAHAQEDIVDGGTLDEVVVTAKGGSVLKTKGISEIKLPGIEPPKLDLRPMNTIQDSGASQISSATKEATNNLFDRIIGSPITRIAMGGLMSWYSFSVAKKAKELAAEANQRAKDIEEIKAGFIAGNNGGFKPCTKADRRLPSRPECYCVLEDGTTNPQTSNTNTCEKYASAGPANRATNYDRSTGYTPTAARGCMNKDGSLNPTCNCDKDQCVTFQGQLNLGPLANISDMKDMLKTTKGFMDGKITTDNLNGASANRMAARLTQMTDKLAKDPKTAQYGKQVATLQAKMKRGFASIAQKAISSGDISPDLAGGGIQSSAPVKNASDVMKAVKSQLSNDSNDPSFASGKKAGMDDFDFGDDSKGGIEMAGNSEDIMKKNYKVDDISNNTHGNIFKIISNRYQSSGMKRLFEE